MTISDRPCQGGCWHRRLHFLSQGGRLFAGGQVQSQTGALKGLWAWTAATLAPRSEAQWPHKGCKGQGSQVNPNLSPSPSHLSGEPGPLTVEPVGVRPSRSGYWDTLGQKRVGVHWGPTPLRGGGGAGQGALPVAMHTHPPTHTPTQPHILE